MSNFDEHTKLYQAFKQETIAAALRRYGLTVEQLEDALDED